MKMKILTRRILGIFMIVLFTAVSSAYAADKPTIDKVVIKPSKNVKRGDQAQITISGTNLDQVNESVVFRKHGEGKNGDYFYSYFFNPTPTEISGTLNTSACSETGSYDLFLQTGPYTNTVNVAKKANVLNLVPNRNESKIISIKPNKLKRGATKKIKVKGKNLKGSEIFVYIYKYITKNGEETSIDACPPPTVMTQTITNNSFTALVSVYTDAIATKYDVYVYISGQDKDGCAKMKNGFRVVK
ncbi:MAG: hypothetical protein HZA77_11375 [Candidatus Schekmanbacteria bacterium]|nr:hypothetical protein [Candidatus Schekmanbacteria bacterium]